MLYLYLYASSDPTNKASEIADLKKQFDTIQFSHMDIVKNLISPLLPVVSFIPWYFFYSIPLSLIGFIFAFNLANMLIFHFDIEEVIRLIQSIVPNFKLPPNFFLTEVYHNGLPQKDLKSWTTFIGNWVKNSLYSVLSGGNSLIGETFKELAIVMQSSNSITMQSIELYQMLTIIIQNNKLPDNNEVPKTTSFSKEEQHKHIQNLQHLDSFLFNQQLMNEAISAISVHTFYIFYEWAGKIERQFSQFLLSSLHFKNYYNNITHNDQFNLNSYCYDMNFLSKAVMIIQIIYNNFINGKFTPPILVLGSKYDIAILVYMLNIIMYNDISINNINIKVTEEDSTVLQMKFNNLLQSTNKTKLVDYREVYRNWKISLLKWMEIFIMRIQSFLQKDSSYKLNVHLLTVNFSRNINNLNDYNLTLDTMGILENVYEKKSKSAKQSDIIIALTDTKSTDSAIISRTILIQGSHTSFQTFYVLFRRQYLNYCKFFETHCVVVDDQCTIENIIFQLARAIFYKLGNRPDLIDSVLTHLFKIKQNNRYLTLQEAINYL